MCCPGCVRDVWQGDTPRTAGSEVCCPGCVRDVWQGEGTDSRVGGVLSGVSGTSGGVTGADNRVGGVLSGVSGTSGRVTGADSRAGGVLSRGVRGVRDVWQGDRRG